MAQRHNADMADEIKIAELPIKTWRGDVQLYTLNNIVGQAINSNATQDDSAPFADTTQMIRIENTGDACNVTVWDAAGTVTATNSVYLSAGTIMDIIVRPGQIISSKIV